jgi:hypothetical protein
MSEPVQTEATIATPTSEISRASLRIRVGNNCSAALSNQTLLDECLDEACEELTRMEWRELAAKSTAESTVADVQYVDLPDDLEEILRPVQLVDATRSYEVPVGSRVYVEGIYPVADQFPSGDPSLCYRDGNKLYFAPVPNQAWVVKVWYRAKLTLGPDEADTLSAAGFDSLVVAYATARFYESLDRAKQSAEQWWSLFLRRVKRKRLSQRTTGEQLHVDSGLPEDRPRDPSAYDPRIVSW